MEGLKTRDDVLRPTNIVPVALLHGVLQTILLRLGPLYSMLSGLKVIRPYGTYTRECQVATLVKSWPSLEVLVIKFMGNYAVEDVIDDNLIDGIDLFEDGECVEGPLNHGRRALATQVRNRVSQSVTHWTLCRAPSAPLTSLDAAAPLTCTDRRLKRRNAQGTSASFFSRACKTSGTLPSTCGVCSGTCRL